MHKSTILIQQTTREKLKKIARKDQTYDDLLNQLIEMKRRESLKWRYKL
jgi:predicted CopG family antitoxin